MSKSLTRTTLICISLLPSLLGCGPTKSEFKPLANGFGVVTIKGEIDRSPGAELHYRGPDGKDTLIWDNLSSRVMITNDLAVFAGDRLVSDGSRLHTYLFAVRAPGPAIDITAQVFLIGAKASQLDLTGEAPGNSFVELETKSDEIIALYFSNKPNNPGLHVKLTWDQISNLLSSAVQGTGK